MRILALISLVPLLGAACLDTDPDDLLDDQEQAALCFECGGGGGGGSGNGREPIGWLDGVDASGTAWGWACDPDDPSRSISVKLTIGGAAGSGASEQYLIANQPSESAVNSACGGGTRHRFSLRIPDHMFTNWPIYGYGMNSNGVWSNLALSGSPRAVPAGRDPIGFFDIVQTDGKVRGWACDPDAPDGTVEVWLFTGGPIGSGAPGYIVAANLASDPGVEVACASTAPHRFEFQLPSTVSRGTWIYAYARNLGGGGGSANPILGGVVKRYPYLSGANRAFGALDSVDSTGKVSGWACDPDYPTGEARVHLYVNNSGGAHLALAGLKSEPAVNNPCGGGDAHRFTYQFTGLAAGTKIYAYVDDGYEIPLSGSPREVPRASSGTPTPPSCTAPDLGFRQTLQPLQISQDPYDPWGRIIHGRTTRFSWEACNYGFTAPSAYLDLPTLIDSTGREYAIAPGGVGFQEIISSSYPWCYRSTVITPYWLPVGSYTFRVRLDAGAAVAECNEANNLAQRSFTVVPP